jgi:hypothetical protein
MLDAPGVATKIAERIKQEIDRYCVQTYDGGHRTHLGASLIGRSCKRYLWYVFRWCKRAPTDGRKQRLFNRGHREEERFVEWLRGIGFKVWTHDETQPPNAEGEYPQYRISDVMEHFGGSLDGIAMFPPGWGIDEPVLLEFKTSGTGAKFNKLEENKMPVEKPDHYAQTSTYGWKYRFRFVLYLCINKNDDALHIEIARLDWNLGQQMITKAEIIIGSQTPLPKLSESPTFQDCRVCDMRDICHEGASIEKNCRSCEHATPIENAQWHCALNSNMSDGTVAPIPKHVIPNGCPSYKAIA